MREKKTTHIKLINKYMRDFLHARVAVMTRHFLESYSDHQTRTFKVIHGESLADLGGGRARRAPPHLPGILVFDDILGHIV